MEQKRDCLVQGYLQKQSGPFSIMWNRRYYRLYPTRLEWSDDQHVRSLTIHWLSVYCEHYCADASVKFGNH
jgi:hypothetical protein